MLEVNGEGIQFKNQNRSIRVPFVIYTDFESLTNLIDTCEQSSERSFTNKYQKISHVGSAITLSAPMISLVHTRASHL